MLLTWAALSINAQTIVTFKKIGFGNFNSSRIHSSPQVGTQLKNGKLIIQIPKEAPSPKILLDLYPDDTIFDLTANSHVYIKIKGNYGSFVRLFPVSTAGSSLPDSGVTSRQKLRCSSAAQWAKYPFVGDTLSNGKSLDNIKQLGIAPDFGTGATQDLVFEIDSILLGSVGYEPLLPSYMAPEGKVWALNSLESYSSSGADYAQVGADGLQLHFSEQKSSLKGINFKINAGYGDDDYINMSYYPILVVGYKGASNDTLRVNLITAPSNTVIPSQISKKINGDGTTSIDFSSLSSLYSFDKVKAIQLFLNDNNSSSGMLTLTALEAGMGIPEENCSGVIGIFDSKIIENQSIVYPNPSTANEPLMVGTSTQLVEFNNLTGTHMATVRATDGYITIPNELKPGLYILTVKGNQGPSYAKLKVE